MEYCHPCKGRGETTPASRLQGAVPKCSWCYVGLEGPNDPNAKLYNFKSLEVPPTLTPVMNEEEEVSQDPKAGYTPKPLHPWRKSSGRQPKYQIDDKAFTIDYQTGMLFKDLSKKYGIPGGSIPAYLKKLSLPTRPKPSGWGKPKAKAKEEVKEDKRVFQDVIPFRAKHQAEPGLNKETKGTVQLCINILSREKEKLEAAINALRTLL